MLSKNQASQGVYLFAYDATNGVAKTGDAANITGHYDLDGTDAAGFATAHPTEMALGVYWQPLAQAETNANAVAYSWSSSTSGIRIDPVIGYTTGVSLPPTAYAASGGLLTFGTSTGQINPSGGKVTMIGNIQKNTLLSGFQFPMVLSSDHVSAATGKTITAERSIDGAAFASCANSAAELTGGWYKIDLATTDLNGTTIALRFNATGCDESGFSIVTQG